jgi:hypothetical protein
LPTQRPAIGPFGLDPAGHRPSAGRRGVTAGRLPRAACLRHAPRLPAQGPPQRFRRRFAGGPVAEARRLDLHVVSASRAGEAELRRSDAEISDIAACCRDAES